MRLLPLLAWALLPGCGAVTGPGEVRGHLGGSLSVNCTYEPGQEMLPKFWCEPSRNIFFTCDDDIVITSKSDPEARKGRFSIRDNRTHREFTVTVDNLSKKDEGTFLCGVRTGRFEYDESADVKVIVYPGQYLWVAGPPCPAWMCPPPAVWSRGCSGGSLGLMGAHAGGTAPGCVPRV
uniref:Ig-like domain-containing protein n=1 Tax=Catharus ustulatus TaxID=91951 RepID=A0A8C3UJA6_CATUS